MINLRNLLKVLSHSERLGLAKIMVKNSSLSKIGEDILGGELTIDVHELESLTNSEKFKFPDEEVGLIGVEIEK